MRPVDPVDAACEATTDAGNRLAWLESLERRMLYLALLFGVLTLMMLASGIPGSSSLFQSLWSAPIAQAHTGSYYGANDTWLGKGAVEWPQKNSNWCAVATVELVANYTWQMQANSSSNTPFTTGGQQRIANDMNASNSVSQWGTPSWNGIGPGFKADIARDFGEDPRSIAWAIAWESTTGSYEQWLQHPYANGVSLASPPAPAFLFHTIIYHQSNAAAATAGIARSLETYTQPLSVTIAHGLHSVVISGVYATDDPVQNYPNTTVDAVNVWDPGVGSKWGGYQSAREVTWDNYTFNTNSNEWGSTYNSNSNDDPDPAVGIYTPSSSYPHHWITYRVDIEPDTNVRLLPDYALDENLSLICPPGWVATGGVSPTGCVSTSATPTDTPGSIVKPPPSPSPLSSPSPIP